MNGFFALAVVWFLTGFSIQGQAPVPQKYANTITSGSLKSNLSVLASDALEGRATGKRGQKMAAAFIRNHFETIGLQGPVQGDFYQPLVLYASIPGETYVKNQSDRFNNFTDIVYYGSADSGGEVTLPLVFVGNGSPADLDQVDVKNKAVLLFTNSEWIAGNRSITLARERGARMVFVCYPANAAVFGRQLGQIKTNNSHRRLSLTEPEGGKDQPAGLFIVSPAIPEKLMGVSLAKLIDAAAADPKGKSLKKIKPATVRYKISTATEIVKTENVLGYMEGTDKKEELLVITAHYDHIGVEPQGTGDLINNGADDDGSGTVAVMEIANAFAAAKQQGQGPRRSILFMTVTGEENGLLGSEYYTLNPVFPLQQTVVNLNIDMVGRRDAKHQNSPPYVYVIGADKLSTELNVISETVNKTYTNLIFDYTYNDQQHPERLYYRSDHWNFAKNNIPIIFYFDGIHEDYHKPSDEIEKIEFDLLAKRAQCVFYTAWEIANRESRIMPDVR